MSVKARGIELWDFQKLLGLENLEEWMIEMKAAYKMSGWPKDYFNLENIDKILSGRTPRDGEESWYADPKFKIKMDGKDAEPRLIPEDLRHFAFKKLRVMVPDVVRKSLLNVEYGDIERGWKKAVLYYRKEETLDVCTMLSEFFTQYVKPRQSLRVFSDELKQRQLKINALGMAEIKITDTMYASILMVRALKHNRAYNSVIEVIKDKGRNSMDPQEILDKLLSTAQSIESLEVDERTQNAQEQPLGTRNISKKSGVCFYYAKGTCRKGRNCTFKHEKSNNSSGKDEQKKIVKCSFCGIKNHSENDCYKKKEKAKQAKEEAKKESQQARKDAPIHDENDGKIPKQDSNEASQYNRHVQYDEEDVWQVSKSFAVKEINQDEKKNLEKTNMQAFTTNSHKVFCHPQDLHQVARVGQEEDPTKQNQRKNGVGQEDTTYRGCQLPEAIMGNQKHGDLNKTKQQDEQDVVNKSRKDVPTQQEKEEEAAGQEEVTSSDNHTTGSIMGTQWGSNRSNAQFQECSLEGKKSERPDVNPLSTTEFKDSRHNSTDFEVPCCTPPVCHPSVMNDNLGGPVTRTKMTRVVPWKLSVLPLLFLVLWLWPHMFRSPPMELGGSIHVSMWAVPFYFFSSLFYYVAGVTIILLLVLVSTYLGKLGVLFLSWYQTEGKGYMYRNMKQANTNSKRDVNRVGNSWKLPRLIILFLILLMCVVGSSSGKVQTNKQNNSYFCEKSFTNKVLANEKKGQDWVVDSGTKSHCVPGEAHLLNHTIYNSRTKVQVVGGALLNCVKRGTGKIENISTEGESLLLKDVLVIPGGDSFLLSMSRMDKLGYTINVNNGRMVFSPKEKEDPEFLALLGDDGLYHIVSENEKVLLEKEIREYKTIEKEEKEVPEEVLNIVEKFLRTSITDRMWKIWDPFVCTGRSVAFWKKLGYKIARHNSCDSFFDPKGPRPVENYDFLITCPPFSLNSHILNRLLHEPRYAILLPMDTLCRKMFLLYKSQFIFLKEGIKFYKSNGEQHKAPHPSRFVLVTKGLDLPKDIIYSDFSCKILNWKELTRKQKFFWKNFKPEERFLPQVGKRKVPISKEGEKIFNILEEDNNKRKLRIRVKSKPLGMNSIDLMHRRCGHVNEAYLRKHYNFPKGEKLSFCDACAFAKSHKHPFKAKSPKMRYFLDELHTDIIGPVSIESYHRNRYAMLCMEIESRRTWVCFLRRKSQAIERLKALVKRIETAKGSVPLCILSDGGELDSQEMRDFCDEKGILFQMTSANASNQNPFIERKNRSVEEAAEALIHQSGVPRFFWEQAVEYAVYILNRTAHKGLAWGTPMERYDGHKGNSHHNYLRVFGCTGWAFESVHTKLTGRKATKGVFLGVSSRKKGYLFYNPVTQKMFTSVHVIFNEGEFPMRKESLWNNPLFGKDENSSKSLFFRKEVYQQENTTRQFFPEETKSKEPLSVEKAPRNNDVDQTGNISGQESALSPEIEILDQQDQILLEPEVEGGGIYTVEPPIIDLEEEEEEKESASEREVHDSIASRLRRNRVPSAKSVQNIVNSIDKVGHLQEFLSEVCFSVKKDEKELIIEAHESVDKFVTVPKGLKEALNCKESKLWKESMTREIDGLEEHGTWEEVEYRPGIKILSGHWVYDIKRHADNSVKYFKSRWVCHGNHQREGIDYTETFAATSQMRTARILLALSVFFDCKTTHCDISNAFTNGILEEEIYMMYPPGLKRTKGKVLRLKKSLYGLKQASRVWNKTLTKTLVDLGFKQCVSDTCLFYHPQTFCLISIHVDDLLITTNDEKFRMKLLENLQKVFVLTDLGIVSMYLGLNVSSHKNGVKIAQNSYVERLIDRYNLTEAREKSLPLPTNIQLTKQDSPKTDEEKERMKDVPYRGIIGSLLYVARGSRPDISFAVSALSRFNNSPGLNHWKQAKRVLQYLKGSLTKGLVYNKTPFEDGINIEICSDSDWGSNIDDRKSISGFVVCINRNPISWRSRNQKCVALSSCEAEFLALSEAVREALWLWELFTEIDVGFIAPITIRVDNQSAIRLAENAVLHQRSKHVEIRYFRIREEVEKKKIKLIYIPTDENIADLLTKSPSFSQFSKLISKLVS